MATASKKIARQKLPALIKWAREHGYNEIADRAEKRVAKGG